MLRTDRRRSSIPAFVNKRPDRSIVVEWLERRRLLSAADPLSVLIGAGAAKSVQYTDPNGTQAAVFLTGPGSATVTFNGSGLSQSANARGVVVNGANITLSTIAATRTTIGSTLQVNTRGKRPITLGTISSNGTFNLVRAPGVILNGDLTVGGWVHEIQLAGAQNGTLTVAQARVGGASMLADLGSVTNESLSSTVAIHSLKANQWVSTTGGDMTLQAPQVGDATIKGAFAPDVSIQGAPLRSLALTSFRSGSITGGTWNVGGNTGVIQTPAANNWNATFNGAVATMTLGSSSVDVTAGAITNLSVHGILSNSTIQLTDPLASNGFDLTRLTATGEIDGTQIMSAGSIGAVTSGRLVQSMIYAGVMQMGGGGPQPLPSTRDDLLSSAEIKSIALRRSTAGSFVGSDVAAFTIGAADLATVNTNNGGTPEGVAANQIGSVTFTDLASGKSIHVVNPASTAGFMAALAAKGINPGDFVVRLL